LVEHPDGQMEIIPWAEVFNQHVLIAKAA